MFEAVLQLSEPWWRRHAYSLESSQFVQGLLRGLLALTAFDHLYLWAFEVEPEIYFDPKLSQAERMILDIICFPLVQVLVGLLALVAIYILGIPSSYRRLLVGWALAAFVWICHAYVYSVGRSRLAPMLFLGVLFVLLFAYWQVTVAIVRIGPLHGPRMRPLNKAQRLRLLAYFVLGLIAFSWWVWEFRRPDNISEAAPFIGQRMINGRGAWAVESFRQDGQSKPYPAKRIFFHRNGYCHTSEPSKSSFGTFQTQGGKLIIHCLPLGPDQLQYAFDADKLHLNAPGFSLTLRQDMWGPGYYNDFVPSFFQKRAATN